AVRGRRHGRGVVAGGADAVLAGAGHDRQVAGLNGSLAGMASIPVTTWSLEQTSPSDLLPAAAPEGDVGIVRAEVPSPEFSRFLYASVVGDIRWTDRLGWSYARWQEYLDRPGVETWVAYERGTPAGYVELEAQDDGVVE